MKPLVSAPADPLAGEARVPGDKSISHRALLLAAVAVGETAIRGLLEGEDVMRTAVALRALGAGIEREQGCWRVVGRGVGGLRAPEDVLDMGNSGTGARLLAGLLATHPFTSWLTGDASLRRRPMARVAEPLELMGAAISMRPGGCLPMTIDGTAMPVPIRYRLPVASAQVKSAVLLAALNTAGRTTVVEPTPTRDHTERMLGHLGALIETGVDEDGARSLTLQGQPEISARDIAIPADPSSAAFPAVAALLVPGSQVTLPGVGTNPLRTGLYEVLTEMGADIRFENPREESGEPLADLVATHGSLVGVHVPAERAPAMIDEYPVLATAAACARGTTRLDGLAELRVKESDRLASIAHGLALCGVNVESGSDWLVIEGCDGPPPGPEPDGVIPTEMDHRIAMAFLILGAAARRPVTVDDAGPTETSFPGFADLMNGLGADIAPPAAAGRGKRGKRTT